MQVTHNLYKVAEAEYYLFSVHPSQVFMYKATSFGEAIHRNLCIVDRNKSMDEIEKDFGKKFCGDRKLTKVDPR
jgi:hypothetical protein